MRDLNWIPYGPHALLIKFAEKLGDEAYRRGRALVAELERHPPPGLIEFVPAFTTLLLEFDPHLAPPLEVTAPEFVASLARATAIKVPLPAIKEIPMVYDGEDLDRVARMHQLSAREVCRLHSRPIYKVYMIGFSPGFPYLGDLDPRLHTRRLPQPRTLVRAGSVAIGGEHTGIYSIDSPAGWNIIGHTEITLFNPARAHSENPDPGMFFLHPGDRVKFVETRKKR